MRLPSSTLREAMMSISDAEILDVVRRLRTYMTTLDNCHSVLDSLSKIDDVSIRNSVGEVTPDLFTVSKKVSVALKNIENSKPYRDMLKKFNMKTEVEEED